MRTASMLRDLGALASLPVEDGKSTLSSQLVARLREAIVSGAMPAGAKINLDAARTQFQVSLSPLREALARLIADGLVLFEDNRGYRVAPVSLADFEEIARLRDQLETCALREAMVLGDLAWESEVMRALHLVNRTERDAARPETLEAWEAAHRAFHLTLIAGCGMPILLRFCSMLLNLNDRYRRTFLRRTSGDRNVMLEIRAGTGGDEAAIFAGDLLRMYLRYAERRGWQVELLSESPGEHGGYKEVVARVAGRGAYARLKFESGTHRVQRIPATEANGRIHTSAVTVSVIPEADEDEIKIDPGDLRIDVFRSSGSGGQHVNKTESAVRITHLPTNIVVGCQEEKSQIKNRAKAMKALMSKLVEKQRSEAAEKYATEKKAQVGSGDRSEKIRTYNYPQSRVTDHRINYTAHNLDQVMDGRLGDLIGALLLAEREAKMRAGESAVTAAN